MKAKEIKLTAIQKKAMKPIINELKDAEHMMSEANKLHKKWHDKMWENLRAMYQEVDGYKTSEISFNFKKMTLTFFVENNNVSKYRKLKEDAICNREFEKAAKYRDLERTAKKVE